jgi:hypothetical protein
MPPHFAQRGDQMRNYPSRHNTQDSEIKPCNDAGIRCFHVEVRLVQKAGGIYEALQICDVSRTSITMPVVTGVTAKQIL